MNWFILDSAGGIGSKYEGKNSKSYLVVGTIWQDITVEFRVKNLSNATRKLSRMFNYKKVNAALK